MIHEPIVIVIIPLIALFVILWLCKYMNFTIIPPDLKPKHIPKKELKKMYKWR